MFQAVDGDGKIDRLCQRHQDVSQMLSRHPPCTPALPPLDPVGHKDLLRRDFYDHWCIWIIISRDIDDFPNSFRNYPPDLSGWLLFLTQPAGTSHVFWSRP